jgi:hypothetical protein
VLSCLPHHASTSGIPSTAISTFAVLLTFEAVAPIARVLAEAPHANDRCRERFRRAQCFASDSTNCCATATSSSCSIIRDGAESDSLSIDVEMFERAAGFFRQHPCRRTAGTGAEARTAQRLHRELAITFDDGYLDNYENAAPVLGSKELPATFSVVPNGWAPPWCPGGTGTAASPQVDDVGSRARCIAGASTSAATRRPTPIGTVWATSPCGKSRRRAGLASRLGSSVRRSPTHAADGTTCGSEPHAGA